MTAGPTIRRRDAPMQHTATRLTRGAAEVRFDECKLPSSRPVYFYRLGQGWKVTAPFIGGNVPNEPRAARHDRTDR